MPCRALRARHNGRLRGGLAAAGRVFAAMAAPTQDRPVLRLRLKVAGLLLLALAVASLVGNRGLVQVYHMHQTRAALEREIAEIKATNATLAEEVHALRSDPSRIEAIAREELGLVKPGELVYQFRATTNP